MPKDPDDPTYHIEFSHVSDAGAGMSRSRVTADTHQAASITALALAKHLNVPVEIFMYHGDTGRLLARIEP